MPEIQTNLSVIHFFAPMFDRHISYWLRYYICLMQNDINERVKIFYKSKFQIFQFD